MTLEQLSAPENGIWMCYRHGKLIDTDECTYTVPMLQTWKQIAELKAKLSQELGREIDLSPKDLSAFSLPEAFTEINAIGPETRLIGELFTSCCVEQIWGRELGRAVRDACIEITKNALTHGNAKLCRIAASHSRIEIRDDGFHFDSTSLSKHVGGGGAHSMQVLRNAKDAAVMCSSRIVDGQNLTQFSLARRPNDVLAASPCAVDVSITGPNDLLVTLAALSSCETVYLVLPKYLAFSDARRLPTLVLQAVPQGKEVTLVGEGLSDGVVEYIKATFENASVINFEE